jgi:hypothetical protein
MNYIIPKIVKILKTYFTFELIKDFTNEFKTTINLSIEGIRLL